VLISLGVQEQIRQFTLHSKSGESLSPQKVDFLLNESRIVSKDNSVPQE
jgi:hypothetical protein